MEIYQIKSHYISIYTRNSPIFLFILTPTSIMTKNTL